MSRKSAIVCWLSLCLFAFVGLVLSASATWAEPPDDSSMVGRPVSVTVEPSRVALHGARAGQQLLVSGRYLDGSVRDLTGAAAWRMSAPDVIEVSKAGYITARSNGAIELAVAVAGLQVRVPVTVREIDTTRPVSFRHEVMPVLSAVGCSDIRCHGAPSGKAGFRLSLWGSEPGLDYDQLTRAGFGRRTNSFAPDESLIFQKALGRISHVGGTRFAPDSTYAELVRAWQAEGLRDDRDSPSLLKLEVLPGHRVLHAPARRQQLAVRAEFSDGRTADVTRLTNFLSTERAVAEVDRNGLVRFHHQGEVAILCRFMGRLASLRLSHIAAPHPTYRWNEPVADNYIDRHVFAKLRRLHLPPSPVCTDRQFIRRLYLDLCGILPSPTETAAFVESRQPDKRTRLIDRLMARPEFADYWTKKWIDVLRVSRDSIQLAGATAYHKWLRERVAEDVSFARVVEQLLTAEGESFKDPAANFFCVAPLPREVKDPHYFEKDLAEATAQLFLGVRLRCAQCHNHPYERWTQDDYLGLAAVFNQVKRKRMGKPGPSGRPDRRQIAVSLELGAGEILREPIVGGHEKTPVTPSLMGNRLAPAKDQDRRRLLVDWLTDSDNPYFAKAVANRLWFHLLGRGIVEPVDDFRDSNPPSNQPLLDSLAADLRDHDFRLKPLIRAIASSRTYQASSRTNRWNRDDDRYFSHRMVRPLPAEVLLDAICEVTGVPEKFEITQDYLVGVPKGTVKLPVGTRAVQLPVNDIVTLINSSGRYVRYETHPFLRTFGQPNGSQTCECDREQTFNRRQALELIVGSIVSKKIAEADNRLGRLVAGKGSNRQLLDELYLRAFSRLPADNARDSLLAHVADSSDRRQAWEDVLWTILNSQEFIYQH